MSVSAYNTSLLASSVRLKTFVRESGPSSENERAERKELNFRGQEAKIAYEEIVSQPSEENGRASRRKNSSEKPKLATRVCEKRQSSQSRKDVKVTANSVLKAVESGDIEYLQQNVTQLNVDIRDDYGWTPLMSAAFCGNYKIIDFLLQLGADTECRDKSGLTAAGLAAKKHYSRIVALLKENHLAVESAVAESSAPQKEPEVGQNRSQFYCSVCKENFRDTTVQKHEASTLHIFNSKPKLPAAMYTIPKQNRGYQMLLNKGWREEGLGPEGEGLKYPIKTVLKRDRKGLGQERKDVARVTHFETGDLRAVERVKRQPNEKTLRKGEREKMLSREARRERAIRRALS